ncbi:MAG: glycosyltransferase family 39 protein [Patescibacteria group bacterium]
MKNKISLALLIGILLLATFLRLYNISDYMTFLGDEGRDVLIAKGILEGNLTLLGPRSSAGDFFMGPAYYYMITPFLWLFQYDPVGPAVMVALVGVATVFLIYFVGKRFFSERAGIMAAALYAVSPLIIHYSRSSWNPNVLPFVALLLIYTTYKSITAVKSYRYVILTGFLLGIAIQLHYLSLFLFAIVVVYLPLGLWYQQRKIQLLIYLKKYAQLFLGFLIGFIAFIAFEVRHGFPNTQAIFLFIFGDTLQGGTYEGNGSFFGHIYDAFFRLFGRLLFHYPLPDISAMFPQTTLFLWLTAAVLLGLAALIGMLFIKNKLVTLLLSLWLSMSLILFGINKKEILDYHMVILFPLPFLLVGNALSVFSSWGKKKGTKKVCLVLSIVLFFSLFLFNLIDAPFRYPSHKQKIQVQKLSQFILSKTGGKPFNFALLSGGNSDHAYRYYFSYYKQDPVLIESDAIDPKRDTTTAQLFVLCEGPCEPLGNSLWEIAGFGRAEIVAEWPVAVGTLYKLVPYNPSVSESE